MQNRHGLVVAASIAALLAGPALKPALARPGGLDPSFGKLGIAEIPVPGISLVNRTIELPNRDLLVQAWVGGRAMAVVRLLPNGAIDPGFATQGMAIFTVPGEYFTVPSDMQVQKDGAILLTGFVRQSGEHEPLHGVVARLTASGAPDSSFGDNGIVQLTPFTAGPGDTPTVMLLQPDGKILIGDSFASAPATDVLRLQTNGQLDQGFGINGVSTLFPGGGAPLVLGLQSDGVIVAVTSVAGRLLPNGFIDPSTQPGTVVASSAIAAAAIQPDDSYITSQATGSIDQFFTLHRFTLTNQSDPSFASPVIGFGATTTRRVSQDYANLVQPDGKVVIAGRYLTAPHQSFGLARVLPTGALDSGFGTGGRLVTPFPGNDATATAVLLQTDGKIVAAGTANSSSTAPSLAVARYLAH